MRIVAVADTHLFEADITPIPDGDLFVHAGDMLRGGTLEELEQFAGWLDRLPHRHKLVIAGNHDRCFEDTPEEARLLLPPGVLYLEDSGTSIEGIRMWGSPWQPAYHDWAFNLQRGEALRQKWALIPTGIEILITHSPPMGLGDRSPIAGREGCADLAERVRDLRVPLHLFGHIHQDGGCWTADGTTSVNATTWECERQPTVIDYDPDTHTVVPVRIPPRSS